jgi:gamma-glutamyltranspeptidase/glutathione hydrolase
MDCPGAVACGHPLTAAAATEILVDGGNAFDAVIAAQFAACVAEPVLASLGGGGFLLAQPAQGDPLLLDFFAQTPRQHNGTPGALYPIDADFGTATQTFHIGPGSIAAPGTVAGMFTAHQRLASLPMSRLVETAVQAARTGVPVNDFQGYIFDVVRPIYEGRAPFDAARTGALLVQPELADTLEQLAREGPGLFYRGPLAHSLVQLCREQGGHLDHGDLEGYQAIERSPLRFKHFGWQVLTNAPPSAGGVLIRHSLAQLGDSPVRPPAVAEALLATAQARGVLLDPSPQFSRGTTHISVIDQVGNLASMTLSNGEGSGCLIPGSGIMLNNMLGEEDINPQGIGRWQPNLRLGSMMSPTLLTREARRYALGSGGSNRIRSALVQTIAHLTNNGQSAGQAVAAPRLHIEGALLSAEPGFTEQDLVTLGRLPVSIQQWPEPNLFFGGVHVAGQHARGEFDAVGDPRRGGVGRLAGDS